MSSDSSPLLDSQLNSVRYHLSEMKHSYGPQVHILSDPYLLSHLAHLCSESTLQPIINELIQTLYSSLLKIVVNQEFPILQTQMPTRMITHHPEGVYQGPIIHPETSVVCVNLARAGTFPSHICFNALNYFINPKKVRQDHISIGRTVNEDQKVTGSMVSGHKIGGDVDQTIVLIPDPMGATGNTMVQALDLYKNRDQKAGKALKYIALHCIVTPEYLKKVKKDHPDLIVYAIRLDRGLSSERALKAPLGQYWDEEKGLNHQHYIVPGGGGFGEIINNAYI